jgi:hypothetical protein
MLRDCKDILQVEVHKTRQVKLEVAVAQGKLG